MAPDTSKRHFMLSIRTLPCLGSKTTCILPEATAEYTGMGSGSGTDYDTSRDHSQARGDSEFGICGSLASSGFSARKTYEKQHIHFGHLFGNTVWSFHWCQSINIIRLDKLYYMWDCRGASYTSQSCLLHLSRSETSG